MKRAGKRDLEAWDTIVEDIDKITKLAAMASFKHSLDPVVRQLVKLGRESSQEREGQPLYLNETLFIEKNRRFIALLSDTLDTHIWPATPPAVGIQDLVNQVIDTYDEYNDIFGRLGRQLSQDRLDETSDAVVMDVEELRSTIHGMEDKTETMEDFEAEIVGYQKEQHRLSESPVDIDEQLREFDAKWFLSEEELGIDLEDLPSPTCETYMSYVYIVEGKYALKKCKQCFDSQRDFNHVMNEIRMLIDNQYMMFVPFVGILWKEEKHELYIVTKYMENGALDGSTGTCPQMALSRAGRFTGTQKTCIAVGLAKGLSILHRKKVMHRDVKLENILLDNNMFPRIADMGTAREIVQSNLTKAVGTWRWMANEVQSSRTYNEKGDVYSYGRVLDEMFTRSGPIDENDPSGPAKLARLIDKCQSLQPDFRPDIDEIVRMFERGDVFFAGADKDEVWSYISQYMLESEDDWMNGESINLFFRNVKEDQRIEGCERLLYVYEKNAGSGCTLDESYLDAVVSIARLFLEHPCDCEREVCILSKLLFKIITNDKVRDSFQQKQGYDVVVQMFEQTGALSLELIRCIDICLSSGFVRVTDAFLAALDRYVRSQDMECSRWALNQWKVLLTSPWDGNGIPPRFYSIAEFVSPIPWDTGEYLKSSCEYLLVFSELDPSILSRHSSNIGRLCECIGHCGPRECKLKALSFIAKVIGSHPPSDNDCKSLLNTLRELVPSLTGNEVVRIIQVLRSLTQHRSLCAAVFHSGVLETVKDVILQKKKPEELTRPFLDIISKISDSNTLEDTDLPSLVRISEEISGGGNNC